MINRIPMATNCSAMIGWTIIIVTLSAMFFDGGLASQSSKMTSLNRKRQSVEEPSISSDFRSNDNLASDNVSSN